MNQLDNDMDELFRNAAEKYPLRTDQMNWEDISSLVISDTPTVFAGKKKRAIGGIIIFLVSLISVTLLVLFFGNQSAYKRNTIVVVPASQNITSTADSAAFNSRKKTPPISVSEKGVTSEFSSKGERPVNTFLQLGGLNLSISEPELQTPEKLTGDIERLMPFKNPTNRLSRVGLNIDSTRFNTLQKPYLSLINPVAGLPDNIKLNTKSVNKNPGLYFGLEGSLQLNEVQTQGFSKLGYGAGIVAGYQVNKRLSFETGFAWSRKCYYTDAKYFDMTNASANMPANMKMISLNSTINIFEIPVKAKYNFRTSKKYNGFITAGLSSYLLTKESNNYLALLNGQQKTIVGKYSDNRNYFSAVVQLGVGYEYKLGRKSLLRAEPYLQIPLKGVGVGSLQVMTAGIHIGVTKFTRK